jgi:ribose transport system permease protein
VNRVFAKRFLDTWFLAAMTGVTVIVFWRVEPKWLNHNTVQSLVAQNAPLALVAIAMTFAIISRHIDLSPGSMIGLVGVVVGLVYEAGGGIGLSVLAGFGVAVGAGLLNGILVGGFGLNAILVTLAAYIWARGLAVAPTKGNPILVDGGLPGVINHTVGGFTITAPVVVLAYLGGWYLLTRTKFGRYTYAMGGDAVGARRAGINVPLYTVFVFVLMGVTIAMGSLIVVGQLAAAQPYTGTGLELDAIIAVIIGGTRLAGGEGSLGRTAMGVTFIGILNSALLNLGLTDAYYQLYRGIALLTVLSIQIWLRRVVAEDARRRHEREQLTAAAA